MGKECLMYSMNYIHTVEWFPVYTGCSVECKCHRGRCVAGVFSVQCVYILCLSVCCVGTV